MNDLNQKGDVRIKKLIDTIIIIIKILCIMSHDSDYVTIFNFYSIVYSMCWN